MYDWQRRRKMNVKHWCCEQNLSSLSKRSSYSVVKEELDWTKQLIKKQDKEILKIIKGRSTLAENTSQ